MHFIMNFHELSLYNTYKNLYWAIQKWVLSRPKSYSKLNVSENKTDLGLEDITNKILSYQWKIN